MEIKHYFTTPLVLFENKSLLSDLKKYIYNYQVEGIDSNIAPHLKKNAPPKLATPRMKAAKLIQVMIFIMQGKPLHYQH